MPRSAARRHNRYPENTCTEEPTTIKALASSTAIQCVLLGLGREIPAKKNNVRLEEAAASFAVGYLKLLNPLIAHRDITIRSGGIYCLSLIDPIERFYGLLNSLSLIPMAASSAEHGLDRSMEVQHRMVTCSLVQNINVLSDAFSH